MKAGTAAAALLKLAVVALPLAVYVLAQQSRLHDAVRRGNLEMTRAALKPWKDIDAMDRAGHSPLVVAVTRRHDDIARFLIERGADPLPEAASDLQQPLWHVAYSSNSALTAVLLAKGLSPNSKLQTGRTWLGLAVERRDVDSVDALLKAGADPNATWSQGRDRSATPLSTALVSYNDKDMDTGLAIAERLLAAGATISGSDAALRMALQQIVSFRRPDTGAAIGIERLKFLMEKGYPLEAPVPSDSPLSMAAASGNLEAVQYLLAKGADPMGGAKPCRANKCPIDGAPLHRLAARYPMPKLAHIDRAIAQALIAAGADIHSPDQYGRTPLQLAERSKNDAVAEVLEPSAPPSAPPAAPGHAEAVPPAPRAAQRPLYAGHPADPKGSNKYALLSAAGTELHAIIAYQAKGGFAEVEVKAQGKPLTLVLAAYRTVEWRLKTVRGTEVAKIVVLGHEPQRVLDLPDRAELIVRSATQHGGAQQERVYYRSDRDELRLMVDRITEFAGVAPKTVIARSVIDQAVIDGVTSDIELAARPAVASPVTFRVVRDKGKLSDDKLTAQYCCAGASSMVLATRGFRRGKRYFEAKLELPLLASRPGRWTNIGVVLETAMDLDEGKSAFIGFSKHPDYRDGDVFGVAVDFDERMAYFRVNGKWISGEPGSAKGMKLPGTGELFAAVSIASGGDAWVGNFGATPFKHPAPAGYLPYGTP